MVQVETNRTSREQEHRLELTVNEIRNYVFPRYKYMSGNFKLVKWTGKGGLALHYKRDPEHPEIVRVGFEEPGYGVANVYYTLDDLEALILDSQFK